MATGGKDSKSHIYAQKEPTLTKQTTRHYLSETIKIGNWKKLCDEDLVSELEIPDTIWRIPLKFQFVKLPSDHISPDEIYQARLKKKSIYCLTIDFEGHESSQYIDLTIDDVIVSGDINMYGQFEGFFPKPIPTNQYVFKAEVDNDKIDQLATTNTRRILIGGYYTWKDFVSV